MALSTREANAAATLIHLLQGNHSPGRVPMNPTRVNDAVQLLTSKVHKTLLAGPRHNPYAARRTLTALQLLPGLVDDLRRDADALVLDSSPNARHPAP